MTTRIVRIGGRHLPVNCYCEVGEATPRRRKKAKVEAAPKRRKKAAPKRAATPKRKKAAPKRRKVAKRRATTKRATTKRAAKRAPKRRRAAKEGRRRALGAGARPNVFLLMAPGSATALAAGPQPIGLLPPAPRIVDAQIVDAGGGGGGGGGGAGPRGRRRKGKGAQLTLGGVQ